MCIYAHIHTHAHTDCIREAERARDYSSCLRIFQIAADAMTAWRGPRDQWHQVRNINLRRQHTRLKLVSECPHSLARLPVSPPEPTDLVKRV